MSQLRIGSDTELSDGQTIKFRFQRDGERVDAFVGRFEGKLIAYENLCRHLPLSLDYDDNRFFNAEGTFLVCQTHGALYHPASGACVDGPCGGQSLHPVKVETRDGGIWLAEEGAQACED